MTTNPFLDNFARFVTDATGAAQGVRREIETAVKSQIERMLRDMDVATREEVEVLRDMVRSMEAENASLKARIAALEVGGARKARPPAAQPDAPAPAEAPPAP
jgi:BMFP domain-containing protein YqiC